MNWINERAELFARAEITPGAVLCLSNGFPEDHALVESWLALGRTVEFVDWMADTHTMVMGRDHETVLFDSLTKTERRARELVEAVDAELVEEGYFYATPDLLVALLTERNKKISERIARDAVWEVSSSRLLRSMKGTP